MILQKLEMVLNNRFASVVRELATINYGVNNGENCLSIYYKAAAVAGGGTIPQDIVFSCIGKGFAQVRDLVNGKMPPSEVIISNIMDELITNLIILEALYIQEKKGDQDE